MRKEKFKKVARWLAIIVSCISIIVNFVTLTNLHSRKAELNATKAKLDAIETGLDTIATPIPEKPISIQLQYGVVECFKAEERQFSNTINEALENPYQIVIPEEDWMTGAILWNKKTELTVDFDYQKKSGEKIHIWTLEFYNPDLRQFSFPKIKEDGVYLIHANYDGMDKYIVLE